MRYKSALAIGLTLVFVLLLVIPANAEQTRYCDVYRKLSFSNNAAICKCEISADSSSDWISATMELWRGTTMLNSWSTSGAESISMDETESVTRYQTYRLVINYSVNGITQSPVETSKYYG